MYAPSYNLRDKWLSALLPLLEGGGHWNPATAKTAAEQAGLSEGEQALAAPNGVMDLVDHFFDRSEAQTRARLDELALDTLRTEARLSRIIALWLDVLSPHRQAVRQAIFFGIQPGKSGAALKRLWSVADFIWEIAGDKSTDFNHYSKRTLLSSVLIRIVGHWLKTPVNIDLQDYIERHLRRTALFGKNASELIQSVFNAVPKRPKKN